MQFIRIGLMGVSIKIYEKVEIKRSKFWLSQKVEICLCLD